MSLGERIQLLRRKQGLSQEELGERLGVSRQAVSKWETGQTLPDTANLLALAQLFGVSVDELAAEKQGRAEPEVAPAPPSASSQTAMRRRRLLPLSLLLLLLLLLFPASQFLRPSGQEDAEAEPPDAVSQWGLCWSGQDGMEGLHLGLQSEGFPFGTGLVAVKDEQAVGDDHRVCQHTVTCEPVSLIYTEISEPGAEPRWVVWSLTSFSPAAATDRDIAVKADEAAVLALYDDGNLYYCLPEHGEDVLCRHDHSYLYALPEEEWSRQIRFYMLNGRVVALQVTDVGEAARDPVDNIYCFPLRNGEPDFSRRQEPEREQLDASRKVFIALYALTSDANLSAEDRYVYRQQVFGGLAALDWQAYGALGEAGRESDTQMELLGWLGQQQTYSAQELLGLQLGLASGPDGFLTEAYAAVLSHAFFCYPVEFARQLAAAEQTPENARQVVLLTAYGAELAPEKRDQAAETLAHWGLQGSEGQWAAYLLQALADPYGELPPSPTGE